MAQCTPLFPWHTPRQAEDFFAFSCMRRSSACKRLSVMRLAAVIGCVVLLDVVGGRGLPGRRVAAFSVGCSVHGCHISRPLCNGLVEVEGGYACLRSSDRKEAKGTISAGPLCFAGAGILLALAGGVTAGRPQAVATARAVVMGRSATPSDNMALVFVKPHACTPGTLKLVPQFLRERGITVLREGSVAAAEIDQQGIIDSHYAAIARVGMERQVDRLGLGAKESEVFLAGYGRSLDEAIAAGEVYSAVTAMEALAVSPTELLNRCLAAGYEKLRSGLYCARLVGNGGETLYVLNGFYARMRDKFVAPGVIVHWFVVSFSSSDLPWSVFRKEIIGATKPSDAVAGSLRAKIRDEWESLGLREETNYQDNGVHASAGPLEALRERVIWLGDDPDVDAFGASLISQGVSSLKALIDDPLIEVNGRKGSAFELLEDVDTREALEMLGSCKIIDAAR